MEEINWDECADEELLEYIVKLGKEITIDSYIESHKNERKIRGTTRRKLLRLPEHLPPKEPTYKEMNDAKGYPQGKVYLHRFGSWERAVYLAGFEENFNYPWKKSPEELIDDVAEETTFSKEFVAKMFEGLDKRKKTSRKRKDKQESDSNSYEISLPAYHFA